MLQYDLDEVKSRYHRCISKKTFLDTFYDCFLSKSDEVAYKFRGTDFTRQKRMLRESILMMVMFSRDPVGVEEDMIKLAERHNRNGVDIPARLYTLWLDSLCEAIEKHDPEHTTEIALKWRAAMEPGIEFLISKY